jgi:microcystin-dependent protein
MQNNISKFTIAFIISLVVIGVLFAQEVGILVAPNGNVGIGTENPTAALEVNGRIKDKTGFIMPVGTILSYGGETAPEGWLLCNGDAKSRTDFADLFAAIGTNFGQGDGSATFNVPDLRGIFLRGAGTNGQMIDAGGNPFSATLGEYQNDSYQAHGHLSPGYYYYAGDGTASPWDQTHTNWIDGTGRVQDRTSGNASRYRAVSKSSYEDGAGVPRTGTETRPANAAVNYIIKY